MDARYRSSRRRFGPVDHVPTARRPRMPVWELCVACVELARGRRTVYVMFRVSLASEHCANAEVYRTMLDPTAPAVNADAKYLRRSSTVVCAGCERALKGRLITSPRSTRGQTRTIARMA